MICYAMLRYVTLSRDMLRYVTLCHVVLRCRETISRAEYERLRAEHDVTLQRNSQLVEERVEISRQMDELNSANSQLRKEIDRFESQVGWR